MLFRRLNWNVVGWFRTVSLISYAIILAGLVMMGYNLATKGYPIKLGLSFTGGTDVTVKYQTPTSTDAIKAALAKIGVNDAQVNTLSKAGEPANERFTISIQFIYIAFRFGWNYIFGLVTVIALVRDAAMMIGIYALAQKRADDAFLAAVLSVIGYSVMETIVILDRIRENTKLMDGEPYDKIVNTSILQTMARSVNTLATVVITLVALLPLRPPGRDLLRRIPFDLLLSPARYGLTQTPTRTGGGAAQARPRTRRGRRRARKTAADRRRGASAAAPTRRSCRGDRQTA